MEVTGFLTQNAEPGHTTLVDTHNGFNELIHLEMIFTVCHCWQAGESFSLNYYKYWVQILLSQPGDTPVIILNQEGVTQGDPLLILLYGITLVPLAQNLSDVDTTLLFPFYADDVAFDGSSSQSVVQLIMLM